MPSFEESDSIYNLYQDYICEIVLAIGCEKRWSNEVDIAEELIKWIALLENDSQLKKQILFSLSDRQHAELVELINSTFVDVTVIKSCVRTLVRSDHSRRESFLRFVKTIYSDHLLKEEIFETFINDFKSEDGELGYPIPVIEIDGRNDHFDINKTKMGPQNLSFKITVNSIAEKLNKSSMVFEKSKLENRIRKRVEDFYAKYYLDISQDLHRHAMKKGILLGYIAFGLICCFEDDSDFQDAPVNINLNDLPVRSKRRVL